MDKKNNRWIFSLYGVNVLQNNDETVEFKKTKTIPEHTTKLEHLESSKKLPEVISFLDEAKRIRRCSITMIDFRTQNELKLDDTSKYKCFWDRNFLPKGIQAIGCPIKCIPSRAVKSYFSEISREKYSISEPITEKRLENVSKRNDKRFSIEKYGYYETDGIFCSFNCCLAYIQSNKTDPLFRFSETLLLKMYNDINPSQTIETLTEIVPAPHWRLLEEFGGHLNIEKFRASFNRVEWEKHGIISCVSIGRLFEDKLKF